MPSSWSASLRFELQFTGENINLWGDKLNTVLNHADYTIAGWLTKALTADYSLSTANAADDEARAAMLKFTGTGAFTVTIPAVSKAYDVWNACTGNLIVTTGSGSTVTLMTGDRRRVLCDGTNVKEPGFGSYNVKDYIDQAILATTGSLPATPGNDGKMLLCVSSAWTPTTFAAAASEARTGTATDRALAPSSVTAAIAYVDLFTNAGTIVTGSAGGTVLDMTTFINARLTNASGALTLPNPSAVVVNRGGKIRIEWGGAGSITMGSGWKRQGGDPTYSGASPKVDIIRYDPESTSEVIYAVQLNPTA